MDAIGIGLALMVLVCVAVALVLLLGTKRPAEARADEVAYPAPAYPDPLPGYPSLPLGRPSPAYPTDLPALPEHRVDPVAQEQSAAVIEPASYADEVGEPGQHPEVETAHAAHAEPSAAPAPSWVADAPSAPAWASPAPDVSSAPAWTSPAPTAPAWAFPSPDAPGWPDPRPAAGPGGRDKVTEIAMVRECYRIVVLGRPWPPAHPLPRMFDTEVLSMCRSAFLPDPPPASQLGFVELEAVVGALARAEAASEALDPGPANALHASWLGFVRAGTEPPPDPALPLTAFAAWLLHPDLDRVRPQWEQLGPFV